ncbi:MAG: serine hydrolase domain-containing protein, partial [Myxococcota bacterium]
DEGVWSLDDPISKYVDGIPKGDQITVRMLGQHTSGLSDPIRHDDFHKRLAANPGYTWKAEELTEFAFARLPSGRPGREQSYSNLNSVVLGMAIEAATGKSWRAHIRTRILEPLALDNPGFADMDTTVRGYRYGKARDPVGYGRTWFDASEWSPSWTNAAGEMTGTAGDLARFIHALFSGDLLSESARQELLRTSEVGDSNYGFHCQILDTARGVAWGHNGDVPGFSSSALYLVESKTTVVVLANLSNERDQSSPAGQIRTTLIANLSDATPVEPQPEPEPKPKPEPEFAGEMETLAAATPMHRIAASVITDSRAGPTMSFGAPGARFRAGSVSKLLTSLLVLRAQEAEVLSLDDPVHDHLPGILVGTEADQVTIAHLLEHTGGLAGSGPSEYATNAPGLLPTEYVTERKPFALRWAPGRHYSYSNGGYTIAGAIVEKAWGSDFDTLMRREVLAPLGMSDSDFGDEAPTSFDSDGQKPRAPWHMPVRPAGALVTTAADLARVVEMVLARGGDFLSPQSIARLERGATGIVSDAGGVSYGLGNFAYVTAQGHTLRSHWGRTEGYQASIAWIPTTGRGYVLLADTADKRSMAQLRAALDSHVTGDLPQPEEPASTGPGPSQIAGIYANYTHDAPQRAWLFALLDARQIRATADGLEEVPVILGSATRWIRVGPSLYQAATISVPSAAFATIDGEQFWASGESYRRIAAWKYYGQWLIVLVGLLAAMVVVLVAFVRRVLGVLRRRHRPVGTLDAFGLASAAYLFLVAGFSGFQLGFTTIAALGTPTVVSIGLCIASVLGPMATILGAVTLWRRRDMHPAVGAVVAGVLFSLGGYLISVGMVPLLTWR